MHKHYMFLVSMVVMIMVSALLLASDRNDKNPFTTGLAISSTGEKEILIAENAGIQTRDSGLVTWGVVNINTATAEQIEELGFLNIMNKKLAKAIIDYRNDKGPFKSLDDLINVKDMTRTKLDDLKPWLVLQGDTTFHPKW